MKNKTNTPTIPIQAEFLYRDGGNYKFFFTANLPDPNMKVGDETTYEKLGYDKKRFFKEVVKYKFDQDLDHNIVEVYDILKPKRQMKIGIVSHGNIFHK